MTILAPIANEPFKLVTYKYLASNPSTNWVNTWEFRLGSTGGAGALFNVVAKIQAFEIAIHHTGTVIDRWVLSTWEPDSDPYNPAAFISTDVGVTGTRVNLTQPLMLEVSLYMRRVVEAGRNGRLYLRGVLCENDIEAPAGYPIISSASTIDDDFTDAITSSGIGVLFGADNTDPRVVLESTGSSRNVAQLAIAGVRTVNRNHRYFDRP